MGIEAHPEPSPDLATCDLPITEMHCRWYRIHRLTREAIFFGKHNDNRFDAPKGEFGVLYVGESKAAAFIETFGQNTGYPFVQKSELSSRSLSIIESSRPLKFVDLTASGLAKIGADNRLCDGDRALSGRWSGALHANFTLPDGLYYRARHDPSECCAAIFDRTNAVLQSTDSICMSKDSLSGELLTLLSRYRFGLI